MNNIRNLKDQASDMMSDAMDRASSSMSDIQQSGRQVMTNAAAQSRRIVDRTQTEAINGMNSTSSFIRANPVESTIFAVAATLILRRLMK